jgi:transitional endoplasmic reticulum ATPase
MKLVIKDAPAEWDGTAYTAIEYDMSDNCPGLKGGGLIKITSGRTSCGARLRQVRAGRGALTIDRHLRRDLHLPEGGEVDVESLDATGATEVRLGVAAQYYQKGDFTELCHAYLNGQPLASGQNKMIYLYSGQEAPIIVDRVMPNDLSVMGEDTKIVFNPSNAASSGVFFKDIGGLDSEIQLIRERVELPLKEAEGLAKLGVYPPRGVLLYGPPGCGKTLIAQALSNEVGARFIEINGPEIYSQYYGESEKKLREIFQKARESAPAVILIDEIDALGPSRGDAHGNLEKRIVATLLSEMDGIKRLKNVIVVATTNEPGSLDPALRRPGRFDYEIRIGIPDARGRENILRVHARKMTIENKEEVIKGMAGRTYGYTGADLMLLCREAVYCTLRRHTGDSPYFSAPGELVVRNEDFEAAMRCIKPSGMREFMVDLPSGYGWDSVGGIGMVKDMLMDEVVRSIKNPGAFEEAGIEPVHGILLYGPPGTGKTLLAKVIACQAGANFISIKGPEIFSKWLGESESRIRQIFAKAREVSPCIVFFDEIDAITFNRGDGVPAATPVVNQLLAEMDGIESCKGVYVIAATNRIEMIDPAFLRPGRFDYHISVPLPDEAARREIFSIHLRGKRPAIGIDLGKLVARTHGFSGADIAEVCRKAGMKALKEANYVGTAALISQEHLAAAVKAVRETVGRLETTVSEYDVA